MIHTPRSSRVPVDIAFSRVPVDIALQAIREIDKPLHEFILVNKVWDASTRETEERLMPDVVERLNHDDAFCESVLALVCDAREIPLPVRNNIIQSEPQIHSDTASNIPENKRNTHNGS